MSALFLFATIAATAQAGAAAPAIIQGGPAAPASARPSIELVYRPPLRAKSSKTFTYDHALALIEFERADGGAVESMQQRLEIVSKETLTMQDEVRALVEGRPTELRRLYEAYDFHADLKLGASGAEHDSVIDWTTPLVGTSVLFTWVPEEKAYGRFYDVRDGIEEALVRLAADSDLRGLLPGRPVSVGDGWTIPLAELDPIFAPAGSLPVQYKRGGEESFARAVATGLGGALSEVLYGADQRTGTFTARLDAIDEKDGARTARIALVLDAICEGDQTGIVQASLTNAERVSGAYTKSARARWGFQGEGELVWDLAAGRFDSLRLSGSEDLTIEIELASLLGPGESRQKLQVKGGLKAEAKRRK